MKCYIFPTITHFAEVFLPPADTFGMKVEHL